MKANYYVLNENTFGFAVGESDKKDKRFFSLCVMRVDYMKGGDPLLNDKVILADKTRCRIATKEDGERFKVIF